MKQIDAMSGSQNSFVTLVTGLPRSGTSMAMQMLQAGGHPLRYDDYRPADTDNPKGYFEYEPVKRTRRDTSWAATARGHAVKVVFNLLYDLPAYLDYRVVFMRRRLEEVVASQSAMLSRLGSNGTNRTAQELVDVYQRQFEKLDCWLAGRPNMVNLNLHFDQVIADPVDAASAINAFLEGHLDEQAMAGMVDPSLYRHRGSPMSASQHFLKA